MRLVPSSPHANIMPRTSNIYKIEGNKGFLAVFQGKSSLKWRIYAGTPKKLLNFVNYAIFRELCNRMRFEVDCAKSNHHVISEGLSKGATVYDPTPLTVVDKKGSTITAQNENRTVTRNSSFFKTLDQSVINHDDDQSRDSGLSSLADIKHQQELPAARTRAHASDPSASKPVSSPGMQATHVILQVHLALSQRAKLVRLTRLVNHHCVDLPGNEFPVRFLICRPRFFVNCELWTMTV